MKEKKPVIKLRVWIDKSDRTFIGPGRIELLENILKTGSISKAASEVNMSYRKAWQLIKDMNDVAKTPFVEKRVGGREGGGAVVTGAGIRAIEEYKVLQSEIDKLLKKHQDKLNF